MDILSFVEQFYLHDSLIDNIGYKFFKDQFVITINFCNWQQPYFKDGDPQNIVGNFVFSGVKEIEIDPQQFTFYSNEILDVKYEQGTEGLDRITFVIEVPQPDAIVVLSFKAKEVQWVPLELCFEQ